MRAIITGGGTGGHIYPALAVARALKEKGWDILYIGSKGGLERRLVPDEGFSYQEVEVLPLPRKLNIALFKAILLTCRGFFQARDLIKEYKPDIILGTGGFVAGPVVLAGSLRNIPTIIHEQNVYPGFTNRLLSYSVDKVALNFADAERYFSKKAKNKLVVTGNPIRRVILETDREKGLKAFKLNKNKKTIFVFGGSQGSASINEAMFEIYYKLRDNDWQIIHITGEKNYQDIINELNDRGLNPVKNKNIKIMPYLKEIELAYAAADLIVYRAGATGLAEITACGIPAILVPYPYAAGNHQEYNARSLADHGAAIVIADDKLNGELLFRKISELINDKLKLLKMSRNSKRLAQLQATENLIKVIEDLVG